MPLVRDSWAHSSKAEVGRYGAAKPCAQQASIKPVVPWPLVAGHHRRCSGQGHINRSIDPSLSFDEIIRNLYLSKSDAKGSSSLYLTSLKHGICHHLYSKLALLRYSTKHHHVLSIHSGHPVYRSLPRPLSRQHLGP